SSEEPDGERAANVHDQGTERKKFPRAFSNESRDPEARSSPNGAAKHYENITEHKKILPAWKESSAHAVFRRRDRRQTPLPCQNSIVLPFSCRVKSGAKRPLYAAAGDSCCKADLTAAGSVDFARHDGVCAVVTS